MDKELAEQRKSLLLRWWGIFWFFLMMFWLPVEDVTIYAVVLIAVGLCGWIGVWGAHRWSARIPPERYPLWGLVMGLAVPLVGIGLIIVKNGLHAHGFSDFTAEQMGQVLKSGFFSGCGGLAAGWMIKRR
jgi:hypothetical protein